MNVWGWTGDIALFAPTAAYNFDMSRFFDKWLKDMRAEQNQGGGIPMIVPMVKIPGQFEMMFHWPQITGEMPVFLFHGQNIRQEVT